MDMLDDRPTPHLWSILDDPHDPDGIFLFNCDNPFTKILQENVASHNLSVM